MSSEQKEQPAEATEEHTNKEPTNTEHGNEEQQPESVDCTDNDAEVEQDNPLQEQLDKAREDVLRAQAEMQNLRRRTERDVANAHKFALEKFVGDLLLVVDNLERALEAFEDGDEGIELTLKSFLDVLKRFQVEQVAPEGEPFDPELHQAMSMVPNPDMENNTVMEVFQKGYTLNGRLVRPAMVVVVKN
ncbi:nucleotide exchange factor GrpE [Porticoccus sp. W117]|uniref:nucleotide exchange factor GrpE n=1 Tax=Porticoccus sp. W117 TaxID=3054777 RepID=UPI0025924C06|nr:nucleotide exchange factor GrpE [Porticoccus sp. W117]MDM3871323.1 nucleotide exchange factor GrpE [Porticoccus sp. W117]